MMSLFVHKNQSQGSVSKRRVHCGPKRVKKCRLRNFASFLPFPPIPNDRKFYFSLLSIIQTKTANRISVSVILLWGNFGASQGTIVQEICQRGFNKWDSVLKQNFFARSLSVNKTSPEGIF